MRNKILFVLFMLLLGIFAYSSERSIREKEIKIEKMKLVRTMVLWEYDCRTKTNGVGTFGYDEAATYFYCNSSESKKLIEFCKINNGDLGEDFKSKRITECSKKIQH